jgi:hypothetical protein
MNCPADATECGPITDPAVRIEQLARIQREREDWRLIDFGCMDDRMCRIDAREQALFLLARGHRPVEVWPARPRVSHEVWFFWRAAQGELEYYWAASRACTGFSR